MGKQEMGLLDARLVLVSTPLGIVHHIDLPLL